MICQRSGSCCLTMPVVIPVKENGEWRAKMKPGGWRTTLRTLRGRAWSVNITRKLEVFKIASWCSWVRLQRWKIAVCGRSHDP